MAGSPARWSTTVVWIISFFVAHWMLSCFFQSFFLHRYGAHRQFTMNKAWERIFYLGTFISQGSSYLVPRSYAVMHREHHAFSDVEGDPHSPHVYPNLFTMVLRMWQRYSGIMKGRIQAERRFEGWAPEWKRLDRIGDHWSVRIGWGALYTLFYVVFAPHWALYFLLPIHFVMGPVHGSIVNWCGHKYGYRNFNSEDQSRNTLPFDFVTLGELFQNNHHRFGQSPNFGARWFEIDPTYYVIRVMEACGIVRFERTQAIPNLA